ncbi:MAG: carboxypeptidase regulatory-like domain-containing protein, partial [Candidatus Micrarchaeota archaeon]
MADFMEGLKEDYDSLIAKLEEMGVPSPRMVVPVVAVLLLIGVAYLAFQNLAPPTVSVELFVKSNEGTPVSNAAVTLFKGENVETLYSDASGKVYFTKVPADVSLSVKVSASGFKDLTQSVSASGATLTLQPAVTTPATKTFLVRVKDKDGNDVSGASIFISFADGTVRTSYSVADGSAEVSVPANALAPASVKVEKSGFVSNTVSASSLDNVVFVELTGTRDVVPDEVQKGSVQVLVESGGNPVSGVTVTLIDYLTESDLRSDSTDNTGNAFLTDIMYGKRFYVSVTNGSGRFVNYLSPAAVESEQGMSRIRVDLQEVVDSEGETLSVVVQSAKDKRVLSGVEVSVFSRSNRVLIMNDFTDSSGRLRFALDKSKQYYVTAFKPSYLPAFVETASVGSEDKIIELIEETEANSVEVNVTLTENGETVPGGRVEIFKADGFPLGVPPQIAGADGTVSFILPLDLNGRTYRVFASASTEDNKRGLSDIAEVREGLALYVAVQAERAKLSVFVKDLISNKSVQNAVVAVEANGEKVLECTTTNATCYFEVAPENEFLLSASSSGYVQTKSASFNLLPGQKANATVYLYPTSFAEQAAVTFLGLFDAFGNQVTEAEPAMEYTARFLAKSPSGAKRTTLFASIGSKSNVNEDNAFIADFDSGFAPNVYSAETSDSACSTGLNKTAGGELKWVQFDFPKGLTGARELSLKVNTRASAKAGEKLVFEFRLYGDKNNVPFLYPYDENFLDVLFAKSNNGLTLSQDDFCQAPLSRKELLFSKTPLTCASGLCQRVRLESEGVTQKDGLTVTLGSEFKLNFEFQPYDGKAIQSLALEKNDAFEILSFSQTVRTTETLAGASGLDFASQSIPASAVSGERISGSIVMRALQTTSFAPLLLTVKFENADDIQISRFVQIEGTNVFNVQSTPQEMMVGEVSNVKVTVFDSLGKPVKDATVALYESDSTPLAGQEIDLVGDGSTVGADGKYQVRVEPSGVGAVGVRVSKDGFATFENENAFTVSATSFLIVTPELVAFSGSSTQQTPKQVIVASTLSLKSDVTSDSDCPGGVISTSPVAFKLNGEIPQAVSISVKPGITLSKECFVTFHAKASQAAQSEARVAVSINVQAPPVPPLQCSNVIVSGGQAAECLNPDDAASRGCNAYYEAICTTGGQSCFVCDVGEATLPSQMALAVSNNKQYDTQSYAIALEREPLECRLQWLSQFDTDVAVYSYDALKILEFQSNQYGYYGYQPNAPYQQPNMWQNPQQYQMPTT